MVFGLAFGAFGLFAAGVVLAQSWSWWTARSYVPVPAQVLKTELNTSRSKGSTTYRAAAEYAYRFQGRQYVATNTGGGSGSDNIGSFHEDMYKRLAAARDARSTVTAWVDPGQPQDATLSREFRWEMIMFLFPFSAVFTAIGIAAFTVPAAGFRRPARGRLIAADHGSYLFTPVLALWWNVLALPLAMVAFAEMLHGLRAVHAVAFIFFAAGLALAARAWRLYERRWLLGSPVLEWLDYSKGRFKARIHFNPVLGARLPAGPVSYPVAVAVSQMEETQHGTKRKVSAVWSEHLGDNDVARGAATIDIGGRAPALRGADDPMEKAYWEVTLRALENKVVFRFKP